MGAIQISYFDAIIAGIVIILGFKGFKNGFVNEFFDFAGIIGGIYYGSRYAHDIGEWISHNIFLIKNDAALTFIGFIVGLFGIWIGVNFLAKLIIQLTDIKGKGIFDQVFGFFMEGTKIFFIISVIIYALSNIAVTKNILTKYAKDSVLYPILVKTGGYIIKLRPEHITSSVKKAVVKNTQTKEQH